MIITVANEQKMTSVRVLFGVTIGYLSKNWSALDHISKLESTFVKYPAWS
jgi:hypothetical protein